MLVLETEEAAARRGVRVLARVTGYGNTGDAANISRPDALNLIPPGATLDAYIRVLEKPTENDIGFLGLLANSLKIAIGNGLRPDIWTRFQERFAIPHIMEFYGATEGNVGMINYDGHVGAIGRVPWYARTIQKIRLVRYDVGAGAPAHPTLLGVLDQTATGMGGRLLRQRLLRPSMDRAEIEQRVREKKGPVTPDGEMGEEKYRLVVEGPPNWTSFRDFWKMFYEEGAVVVSSTYAKVGGLYDFGFRHDADHPLESLADYCLGCYTNLNLPSRVDMICKYIDQYQADGLLINSIKSCNSFSAGQLLILREVEKRTGRPAAFIESDLVDPRYFSAANVKNRLESYFQMIKQKRTSGIGASAPKFIPIAAQ